MDRTTHNDGTRFYICPDTGAHLPSVTTILSATGDKTSLLEWRDWVGDEKADRIRDEACAIGTLMHTHLENYILGAPRPRGNNLIRKLSEGMADVVIEQGLPNVDEVWGLEVALHFPELYAGTSDIIGVYKGKPAIMDYKTTKKMKSRSKIDDYMQQGCAYALAHNLLFDTNISTVVIFMASRDFQFETFVLEGNEFNIFSQKWQDRIIEFYNARNNEMDN